MPANNLEYWYTYYLLQETLIKIQGTDDLGLLNKLAKDLATSIDKKYKDTKCLKK